ncbi:hypothetical protein Gorai_006662, partial [Gossypium raimondii]|nr:hypothetical protein [Gossypium raimondii]
FSSFFLLEIYSLLRRFGLSSIHKVGESSRFANISKFKVTSSKSDRIAEWISR